MGCGAACQQGKGLCLGRFLCLLGPPSLDVRGLKLYFHTSSLCICILLQIENVYSDDITPHVPVATFSTDLSPLSLYSALAYSSRVVRMTFVRKELGCLE